MTDTLETVAAEDEEVDQQLLAQARVQGVDLVDPNGLLSQFTQEGSGDCRRS